MVTVAARLASARASFGGLWRYGRPAGIGRAGPRPRLPHALSAWRCCSTAACIRRRPAWPATFNLDGYVALATAENLRALANTVGISLVKTVLSLALAILLAWIVARTDTPGRGVLEVLITLPFFIPPILTATAWAMLGNAQVGTINLAWRWLTGTRRHAGRRLFLRRHRSGT